MNERRELRVQERELENDRRREHIVALLGVLSLIPVAAIILVRQVFFLTGCNVNIRSLCISMCLQCCRLIRIVMHFHIIHRIS